MDAVIKILEDRGSLTRSSFITLAKRHFPNLKFGGRTNKDMVITNLNLVKVQTRLNRKLRKEGKYLKSQGCYSRFVLLDDEEAIMNETYRMLNRSAASSHSAKQLQIGLRARLVKSK